MIQSELETKTIAELYDLAKQHGIPSYRKYKKAQLIEMLQAPAPEKKKRGRPAKEKSEEISPAKEKPQLKKRGRPAKAAAPGVSSISLAISAISRLITAVT